MASRCRRLGTRASSAEIDLSFAPTSKSSCDSLASNPPASSSRSNPPMLRVAYRAGAAADLATIVAVGDQDQTELAYSGRLRLTADAAEVARDYFARNLL